MEILESGSRPTRRVPPEWFTGTVLQDVIFEAPEPARTRAVMVTFEPGARTNWHTHPLGQTLHIVSGTGRVQSWGGPVREVRAGDTVWFPPGEKHWHGAAPDRMMVHLAISEHVGGSYADWMEPVSDGDYTAAPSR